MFKARVIFILCFVTAFAAGACAGMLWQRRAKPPQDHHWLAELNLSPEQQTQISAIISEGWENMRAQREKREAAEQQREETLKALITPEQKQHYDEINAAYRQQVDEQTQAARAVAEKQRDEALKALFTSDQKQRYDEALAACRQKLDDIAQALKAAREDAYQRTKALLTESQRELYDQIRQRRPERGRGRGDSARAPGAGRATGASTDKKATPP